LKLWGKANAGKLTWIGIGSSIINNINIGDNVIVGAGASVINTIPDNVMILGVPAKKIKI